MFVCVLVEVESRVGEIYDVVFMAIEQMDSGFMCTSTSPLHDTRGSDLAVNNIPAEGMGAKGTEEVWWWGEGCRVRRRTEVKEKQRIPLYVRVYNNIYVV